MLRRHVDSFLFLTSFPILFIPLHRFRASAFAHKVEPTFPQVHRLARRVLLRFSYASTRRSATHRSIPPAGDSCPASFQSVLPELQITKRRLKSSKPSTSF